MFETNEGNLSSHLVKDIGLQPTDFVWLHSGVVGLGLLSSGIQTITNAFKGALYEGTLIIPTFSYSWCKNETFDPLKTECPDMGSYASRAWKNKGFIRSLNPNFSVAALRNTSNTEFIKQIFSAGEEKTCFGKGSIFDRMYQKTENTNGYIILLGGAHNDVVFRSTFLHYIEEKIGVPYRYKKKFYNPDLTDDYVEQYARFFSKEEYNKITGQDSIYEFPVKEKYDQLGKDLVHDGLLIQVPFGYSKTRALCIRTFCDWLEKKLLSDQEYLLK